jgi:hypothetical protein
MQNPPFDGDGRGGGAGEIQGWGFGQNGGTEEGKINGAAVFGSMNASMRQRRGISKFDPKFTRLTPYNHWFTSLSKYNPGQTKFFDLGFSTPLLNFEIFFLIFPLQTM